MGALSAVEVLALPVRHNGIELGRPVDLSLDLPSRRVLGLEVRCRDEAIRFLPLSAARVDDGEIAVGSPLILLDDVVFYRQRSTTLRALRGAPVRRSGAELGELRDILLARDGQIHALVVGTASAELRRVPLRVGVQVGDGRAAAA